VGKGRASSQKRKLPKPQVWKYFSAAPEWEKSANLWKKRLSHPSIFSTQQKNKTSCCYHKCCHPQTLWGVNSVTTFKRGAAGRNVFLVPNYLCWCQVFLESKTDPKAHFVSWWQEWKRAVTSYVVIFFIHDGESNWTGSGSNQPHLLLAPPGALGHWFEGGQGVVTIPAWSTCGYISEEQ